MHGSSSVPKDLIDLINQSGGEMPETFGVPVEEIQRASATVFAKSTSIPICGLRSPPHIRKVLAASKAEFDPAQISQARHSGHAENM